MAPRNTAAATVPPGSERVFVRMAVWQTVIAVVGVFIAVVALYAALQESEAVRKQTAATVWPIVQFSTLDSDDGEHPSFVFRMTNAGVGPARMRGMRLVIAGEVVHDWDEVLRLVGDGEPRPTRRNYLINRVLRPGEDIDIFATNDPVLVRGLLAATNDPASSIEYCYCSIFDACWLGSSSGGPGTVPSRWPAALTTAPTRSGTDAIPACAGPRVCAACGAVSSCGMRAT